MALGNSISVAGGIAARTTDNGPQRNTYAGQQERAPRCHRGLWLPWRDNEHGLQFHGIPDGDEIPAGRPNEAFTLPNQHHVVKLCPPRPSGSGTRHPDAPKGQEGSAAPAKLAKLRQRPLSPVGLWALFEAR
jgi:hypothetical protein